MLVRVLQGNVIMLWSFFYWFRFPVPIMEYLWLPSAQTIEEVKAASITAKGKHAAMIHPRSIAQDRFCSIAPNNLQSSSKQSNDTAANATPNTMDMIKVLQTPTNALPFLLYQTVSSYKKHNHHPQHSRKWHAKTVREKTLVVPLPR